MNLDRLQTMIKSYESMYYGSGKTQDLSPEKSKAIATAMYKSLEPIPTDHLESCFTEATRTNKMPGTYEILKAWDGMKFDVKRGGTSAGAKDKGGAFIRYGTFYTLATLPNIFWSNYMLELRSKSIEGKLTDGELRDWLGFSSKQWAILDNDPELPSHDVAREDPNRLADIKKIEEQLRDKPLSQIISNTAISMGVA